MDIVQIFNISLGRVVGFICSFMILVFFLIGTGVALREFTDSLKIFVFPITPISVLNISAMIAITLIVSLGLETIARFSILIGKSALFIYLLLLVLGIRNYHPLHMFPFWGYGIDQTIAIGVKRTGSYAEILIFAVIAGSLQGASHIKKAGYLSLILSGILISVGLLCYTFTFEYTTNQELAVPFYTMVRAISYGSFVQRMDPLIMFSWTVTTLTLLAILFYCAVSVFCKMHKINDTRPIIPPMAVLIFIVSMIPQDFSSVVEVYIQYQREFGAILLAVLPGTALIASVIRKKGEISQMRRPSINLRIISVLVLCAVLITPLTACYDSREVDDWAFINMIGIESGIADKLRFTVLFSTLKQSSGGSGSSSALGSSGGSGGAYGKDFDTISIDSPTAFAGVNMINSALSRTINYSQSKYLVISEELAKKGVGAYINGMVRTQQVRRGMYVIVSKGKASDFINTFSPVVGTAISKTQENMMKMEKETGLFDAVTYFDFINNIKSYYRMPTAALAAVNDFSNYKTSGIQTNEFKGPGDYYAGQLPRLGGDKEEFLGLAIFDGDKMVGELNGEQTRAKLMVTGQYQRGTIVIPDPKNPDLRVTTQIKMQKKAAIKVKFQNKEPIISVKLSLEGDMVNLQSDLNYEKGDLKKLMEESYRVYIKKKLDETIDKCKELKADILGFGDVAAMHFGTIQEFQSYNWLKHFEKAKVNTEVDFVIRRTGTLLKTNKIITSEGVKE